MVLPSPSDMFHAAPPPPPPLHYGSHPPRQPYPTTPVSDPHASPHQHQQPSYHPRQLPTTPQTPNYASTSRSFEYPPTPHTPQFATPNTHHPHTPVQPHHLPQHRHYYPSPPVHQYPPHAGPSRLQPPPTHPHHHYQQRYDNAGPTQALYRPSHDQYPSYPHSAPPRVMQNWSDQPPVPSSPTSNRAGAPGDQDVCSQFLNLANDNNGPDEQAPPQGAPAVPVPVVNSAPTMKLIQWTPQEGRDTKEIIVTLQYEKISELYDEQSSRAGTRAFRGMFGKLPCSTRVSLPRTPGAASSKIINLFLFAPPLHLTGSTERSNRVPVYIQALRSDEIEETLLVGEFTYVIPSHGRVQSMPPALAAEQQVQQFNPGTKRAGEPLEQLDAHRPWSASGVHHGAHTPHPPVEYGSMPPVDQSTFKFAYPEVGHEANSGYDHTNMVRAPLARATAPPLGPSVMQPSVPMVMQPPPLGQPSLVRSTQVAGGSSWYDRLRAEIVFQNDLLSMTRGWTPDEWTAKRRLVKVWRRQVDSQIFMAFRPITLEEYPESKSAVVVSCIFREDKNTCYITSVDIIYLLEAVIGQRFSIEEKNRIRRNLEGFRPQTVSKNKPGSEDFFRTVMAFPEPKPRNIEKDLKVFQWDCLPAAVKKIISKYTAQYHPSGEPLVPQGVTDAHHEIQAPHPDYHPAAPAPVPRPQPQLVPPPQQAPSDNGRSSGLHPQQGGVDVSNYDPALFPQPSGYGNGTSASRQTSLQVDTAAANAYAGPNGNMSGNAYFPAAAYSPTPQMTHSSSSNVVPSEVIVSPITTGQNDHVSAPPSATVPHVGYLQQQQATAPAPPPPPPPYSDLHSQQYWPSGQDAIHSTAVYSMAGSGAYDDGGMYANLVMKPIDDDTVHIPIPTGEVDLEVRNIYTANSA